VKVRQRANQLLLTGSRSSLSDLATRAPSILPVHVDASEVKMDPGLNSTDRMSEAKHNTSLNITTYPLILMYVALVEIG